MPPPLAARSLHHDLRFTWAVVAIAWTEPKTEADYRRLSWYAPVSIAFPFGVFMGLLALRDDVIGGVIGNFSTWGILALAVGYFYAIVVNVALVVAKRLRCVQ